MKKIIFGFIASLAFFNLTSCSDNNDITESSNNRISKVLNQENVYNFVKKHIEINDKIISLLENETNLNNEILFKYSSENCNSENEFKDIIQKSGILKYNELIELISLQVKNGKKFQSENQAFFSLDLTEQNKLLTKYFDEILNEKLIESNEETKKNNYVAFSCASQYNTAKNRCQRNLNLHGAFAIAGCLGGPWACAAGLLLAGAEHTNCMKDAKEDYEACING
jgi:hypothetical protein